MFGGYLIYRWFDFNSCIQRFEQMKPEIRIIVGHKGIVWTQNTNLMILVYAKIDQMWTKVS